MNIRKTLPADLPAVMEIYAEARKFMAESGNPTQWANDHPPQRFIERDIADGKSYVAEENGEIAAVFYFAVEPDASYAEIDGAWLNDAPYGVVHRIAKRRNVAGAGAFCLNWAFDQCDNVRIDTHGDNAPMLKLLRKLGFAYCGVVWLAEIGEERLAFQKSGVL